MNLALENTEKTRNVLQAVRTLKNWQNGYYKGTAISEFIFLAHKQETLTMIWRRAQQLEHETEMWMVLYNEVCKVEYRL